MVLIGMSANPAPYWGAINTQPAVMAQRQNSLRKGSVGSGYSAPNLEKDLPSTPQGRSQPQPQPRPERASIQSQAPTVSTQSPFASPVESTFRAEGLAPRPPSYKYGGVEPYNKESLERRRKRASREKAQQLHEEAARSGPPPPAPDVPRQPLPSGHKSPYSNGGGVATFEPPTLPLPTRHSSEVVERSKQSPEDYYSEVYQPNTDRRRTGRQPLNLNTDFDRPNPSEKLVSPSREEGNADRSNIRRGSVQARKERPEIRSAVNESQGRRRSSATDAESQRRREWASERSPLQRLEQTLLTKEEKRARMEVAEQRAREAKFTRSGQNTVHFGITPSAAPKVESQALPTERHTRGLGSIENNEQQRTIVQENRTPLAAESAETIEKHVDNERRPQPKLRHDPQAESAASQPEIPPGVQRGRSFRERAGASLAGAMAGVLGAGASLQRSTSNKLKKNQPKTGWAALNEQIERDNKFALQNKSVAHDDQTQTRLSTLPLKPAPANIGGSKRGGADPDINRSKREDNNRLNLEDSMTDEDDDLDVAPKRRNSSKKVEQLMGHKVNIDPRKGVSPQEQLYADRLGRSEELGPGLNPNRIWELEGGAAPIKAINKPHQGVSGVATTGSDGQEQDATGPDGHHYFSKIVHAGRDREQRYLPGEGLYAPVKRLDEWKTSRVASLTGVLLDINETQSKQTEEDRAWWEAGNTHKRRPNNKKTADHTNVGRSPEKGPTKFSPPLYLKCGPLLRYCGMRKEKLSQRSAHRGKTPDKEIWRGTVMIVTEDLRSTYDAVPTLRLFCQPRSLLPPPPHHINSAADVAPEYVDPLAGQQKVGRDGGTLYVRPVEELDEEKDLSKDETDNGIFEKRRSSPTSRTAGSDKSVDGEMVGKVAVVQGFRLHAERGVTFWRFNIEVELTEKEQRIAYSINQGPAVGFWVPALGQSMNIMFHSCNGFSLSVNPNQFSGPDPMWRDVLNTHQTQPFHVMIGGGDQIYNDCVMTQTDLFSEWLATKNPLHKHNAPFTREMQDELDEFYLNRYSMWFSQGLFGLANSQIPMVNIYDDHDIIDGFGSYPHHFMDSPVFSGLGNIAFKYYMLFQHQSSIDEGEDTEPSWLLGERPGPYIKELSRSVFMSMGAGISFLGMDCRTERSREDVLSEETYHKILDRCHDEIVQGETRHLIVLLGVPLAYPRLVWLENILTSRIMDPVKALGRAGLFSNLLNKFDGGVEVLDDLDDHWTSKTHKRERQYLLEDLQDLAADKSVRITILGGDVHLAAVGQFYSNPKLAIPKDKDHRYMPNVISSAIVNTPPPDMVADILNKRNKVHHFDDETDESMIPLFTHDVDGKKRNNNCLLPRRNWCSIRPYNPELSPPPTPTDDRSPSPPRRVGLLRRLSMTRRPSYRADAPARDNTSRPPISGGGSGLLRRLSHSRGRPMEPRPSSRSAPPRRTLSLTRDFNPGSLFRRLSSRRGKRGPDSGGINGYGADTDSESPYSTEDLRRTRIRGGAGDEEYFRKRDKGKQHARNHSADAFSFDDSPPPTAAAPTVRSRVHEPPPQSHRNHNTAERVRSAEALSMPALGARPRPFHRTPTGLSEKAARKGTEVREEDAINLEGGLEVTLNIEVNQKDPAGITTPYRLLVPALWFDDHAEGVGRKKSVVERLLGVGRSAD